jgi:hypothetical protein
MPTASTSNRRAFGGTQGRTLRPCFFVLLALALAAPGLVQARPAAGRIRPPAQATCPGNNLTSYFGKVIGYRRDRASVWLRIATDYDTIEEVTAPADIRGFHYQGAPFSAKDWPRIERKPGVLLHGVRATAWVCGDGRHPVLIDWNGATE